MDINKMCPGCMQEVEDRDSGGTCPRCGYNPANVRTGLHQMRPFTILAGRYMVGKVIGEGGFGMTYLGYDLVGQLVVAIKEFYPAGFVTRDANVTSIVSMYVGKNEAEVSKWRDGFLDEARSLVRFSGLNGIVEVRDFFNENNTAYIVMEYIDGVTLRQYLEQNGGKIPAGLTFQMMEPVIRSMSRVHDAGMIHRDISPDNIMITKYGGMKLIDFGAARDFAGSAEKSLSIMLKPGYAPEEQYRSRGKQGPWSDVYAISATIYKCVTGITPVESMERMRADTLQMPKALGINITDQQNEALRMGMAVYAEERLQNMDALYRALYSNESYAAVPPRMPDMTAAAPAGQAAKHRDSDALRRNIVIMAGALCGILVVAMCGLAVYSLGRAQDADDYYVQDMAQDMDTWAAAAVDMILDGYGGDAATGYGNVPAMAPAAAETYYEEPQYEEPQYEEPQYAEPYYEESQYVEPQYEEPQRDKTAIHRYEFVKMDCTWTEAYNDAIRRGGYLAHINSAEEYVEILRLMRERGLINEMGNGQRSAAIPYLWIGAKRRLSEDEYHWINPDGTYDTDEIIDYYWYSDGTNTEPSLSCFDKGTNKYYDEDSVMMLFRRDIYYWNDVPDDVIAQQRGYSGGLGYICEYED